MERAGKRAKVLVLSDTHGEIEQMNAVIEEELPFDLLIHCGDSEVDLSSVLFRPDDYALLAVRGNCDWTGSYPELSSVRLLGHQILAVHGHLHGAGQGAKPLFRLAKKNRADILCFGHTHRPLIEESLSKGILLINPGSLTRNRPYPRCGSYAVLNLTEGEMADAEIRELDWDY